MGNVNRTWVFDLDGTLIDSQPAIIESCKAALEIIAPQRMFMIDEIKIGPALPAIGKMLLGEEHASELGNFIDVFKATYDEVGVRNTYPYEGVTELIRALSARGDHLIIATNKRGTPTRKLIELLGWAEYFSWIGCLDEAQDPALGKSSVITGYLNVCARENERGLSNEQFLFVGDTVADAKVAEHFSMPFVHAAYGYEPHGTQWNGVPCLATIRRPIELLMI